MSIIFYLTHLLFTNKFCLCEQLQEIKRKGESKGNLFVEIFLFGYDLLFEYFVIFDNNLFINYLFNFKHVSMYVYNMSCIYFFLKFYIS